MGRADKNADTKHDACETSGAKNNTDADFDVGGSDKNIYTEHNAEKEAKMCESNLF